MTQTDVSAALQVGRLKKPKRLGCLGHLGRMFPTSALLLVGRFSKPSRFGGGPADRVRGSPEACGKKKWENGNFFLALA
jgi:hypothetical protein